MSRAVEDRTTAPLVSRRGDPFPLDGPVGSLEAELHRPAGEPARRAVIAHPHPLYGGTMDNGVVMLAVRALVGAGAETLRFNFRGVGGSDGEHDEGRGERGDLAAAIAALSRRQPRLPLIIAGYSFGAVMTLELLTSEIERARGSAAAIEPAGVLLIAPPVTHYRDREWKLGAVRTVVIYGERDGLTPPPLLEERAASWGTDVRCTAIPGVGHDLGSFAAPRGLEAALQAAVAALVERAAL
jgi:alpha/beta superfamily hydrolase